MAVSERFICTMYSEAEKKLFTALHLEEYLNKLEPVVLYRVAAEQAFVKDERGPIVDALRRGCQALLHDGTPYRHTEAFDSLLQF